MARTNTDNLARDLGRLLNELMGLHAELAMHMRTKLDAIKRADTDQITAITARELVLADRVLEREGLRRQMTRQLIAGLGVGDKLEEPVRLTVLADYLPEPGRSQVLVAAAGLRERVHEVERLRVTSSLITQEMLKHLGEVMTAMRSGGPSDAYGRGGKRQRSGGAHVFEAVG
ncbi:MAG: flagellar protein FlgN [Phycisphaerae bacterium]|nr:flagellar protein FlgN [Phycisphaerae bacterium]